MKKTVYAVVFACVLPCLAGCGTDTAVTTTTVIGQETSLPKETERETMEQTEPQINELYTTGTKIAEVVSDPVFGNYGRLIFPADSGYYSGDTLGSLRFTWYSNIDPDRTVEIANYMKSQPRKKRTRGFSSSEGVPEKNLPYAMRAVASPMWEPCTTAFPMRWNCQRKATMPLR